VFAGLLQRGDRPPLERSNVDAVPPAAWRARELDMREDAPIAAELLEREAQRGPPSRISSVRNPLAEIPSSSSQ
jgi:hypothetical protein